MGSSSGDHVRAQTATERPAAVTTFSHSNRSNAIGSKDIKASIKVTKSRAGNQAAQNPMIGGHRRIGCPRGDIYQVTFFVADKFPILVASAYPAYIANVVTKKRNNKVEPIARRNTALLGVLPAQNLLAYKCHHYGVVHIVIGGIAVGDVL